MDDFEIVISKGIEADQAFIFSTWLRSFKQFSYFAKRIKNPIYYKWHHALIDRVMKRDTTTILIAHPKGDRDLICGYIVYEEWDGKDVLHFAYVKGDYQRHGIFQLLLDASKIDYNTAFFSHWTFATDTLIERYPNMTYSPYHI